MDNTLNQLFYTRHSIRKYKDEQLDPEKIKMIFEAGLLAPSSKSSRPWQFIAVEDADVLVRLAECKPVAATPIARAKLAIVICADPQKSDVYVEDCSVAASFMQLQAADLGIGSCWIQVRNRLSSDGTPAQDMIKRLLDIPEELQVVMVLSFGISDEVRRPVDPDKLQWEKVHIGKW